MPRKSKKIEVDGLAAKMLRCHRAHEAGKRAYAKADALLAELLQEVEPGQVVKIDEDRVGRIVDKLEGGKTQAVQVAYFRRYELKILP